MSKCKEYIGLNSQEVEQSRREHGANILTPPAKKTLWKLYLEKFNDPLIRILLVAAAISLMLSFFKNDFLETIGIFLAIFFATAVGFYFERDATKKFAILNAIGEEQPVKVRRNGHVQEIARKDVVVGDLIFLETGDEIPADGTLVEAVNMQVDESSLTGEPLTTKHAEEPTQSNGEVYAQNQVMRSTMVMNGRGVMIVESVGDDTEIGKVALHSSGETNVKTPLSLQLERLGNMISLFGFILSTVAGISFFIIGASAAHWHMSLLSWIHLILNNFMFAVTLIVMAVPEGLPMAITLSLALNMRRMLKSNNLVRKLHACETMGAVNIICTDKTGTLTQNRMTVSEAEIITGSEEWLARCIALNTTAHLDDNGEGIGNSTETALLRFIQGRGYDYQTLRQADSIVEQKPFSTELKYMSTTAIIDGKETLIIKGAPEIIITMCDVDKATLDKVNSLLADHQSHAMRTLAFATDNHLQAIVAISDPVREDVPQAISECIAAGIEVKVITGDTSATALEIARQIGLVEDKSDKHICITGTEFAEMSDTEALAVAKSIKVMSRARPTDKQRLVQLLQSENNIVAVTGDGTNDAPALNYAHVGLSLGSGTSVAKQSSDITLIDDSFGSIAQAVMWGRSLYKNIQRFLFFQLVVNVAALILVIGGAFIGTEMPLTVPQILWVNLIMDSFAAMALTSLPPSKEVMNEQPRRQSDFIITKSMAARIFISGIVFGLIMLRLLWEYEHNAVIDIHELTIIFTFFVMLQFWNLFNAKLLNARHSALADIVKHRRNNLGFLLVLLMIFIGQILIVNFGGEMFRTSPLSVKEWCIITLTTSLVMLVGEAGRLVKRLFSK